MERRSMDTVDMLSIHYWKEPTRWTWSCSCNWCTHVILLGNMWASSQDVWHCGVGNYYICNCWHQWPCWVPRGYELAVCTLCSKVQALALPVMYSTFSILLKLLTHRRILALAMSDFGIAFKCSSSQLLWNASECSRVHIDLSFDPKKRKYICCCFEVW